MDVTKSQIHSQFVKKTREINYLTNSFFYLVPLCENRDDFLFKIFPKKFSLCSSDFYFLILLSVYPICSGIFLHEFQ